VITVTSFFLWYRPIYLGYKKEGGLALFFCESTEGLTKDLSGWGNKADLPLVWMTFSFLRSLLLFRGVALVVLALVSLLGFILVLPATIRETHEAPAS
jgi:hypothetical protein